MFAYIKFKQWPAISSTAPTNLNFVVDLTLGDLILVCPFAGFDEVLGVSELDASVFWPESVVTFGSFDLSHSVSILIHKTV